MFIKVPYFQENSPALRNSWLRNWPLTFSQQTVEQFEVILQVVLSEASMLNELVMNKKQEDQLRQNIQEWTK